MVLVVDDDPDIRELLCELVEEEPGCMPVPATNGREALDALAKLESPPCLILLDMMMPVMNGREVLGALEKDDAYARIPVTVITAAPGPSPRTSGGALSKPFTAEAMRKLLRAHCVDGQRQAEPPTLISRIAQMLLEGKEALICEWTSRVRRDPAILQAHALDEDALRNNIPLLIDALVQSLTQSAQRGGPRGANAQEIGGEEAVRGHAHHRMEQGYSLAEELREMSHLRGVFVDMCTQAGLVLKGEEAKLFHSVIDEVMTTAALEIENLASADLRRDVALRELFTAILGHDLRSPLTGIMLAASKLLMRDDLPEVVSKDHRRIAANAARMQRLIEDLLDMTRVRTGGLPIERRPTDLRHICEGVVEEALVAHPRCVLELTAPHDVRGDWDPDRVTQLVQNLVHNAIEHGQPNAPIRIEVRDQGSAVELEVHNLGAPLPPEVLPSIFDPFIQGEPAVRRSKGLGLGLFIAKAIVEGHGGTIRATSDQEHGTSFVATLPRVT